MQPADAVHRTIGDGHTEDRIKVCSACDRPRLQVANVSRMMSEKVDRGALYLYTYPNILSVTLASMMEPSPFRDDLEIPPWHGSCNPCASGLCLFLVPVTCQATVTMADVS
jgi:hypothetical protein